MSRHVYTIAVEVDDDALEELVSDAWVEEADLPRKPNEWRTLLDLQDAVGALVVVRSEVIDHRQEAELELMTRHDPPAPKHPAQPTYSEAEETKRDGLRRLFRRKNRQATTLIRYDEERVVEAARALLEEDIGSDAEGVAGTEAEQELEAALKLWDEFRAIERRTR